MKTTDKSKTSQMNNIALLLLLFTGMVNAQIVNIPDLGFKSKLLAADVTNTIASTATNATIPSTYNKIDVNNDGEIQQSEAAAVTLLDVSFSGISDLTGIEEFVNLHKLNCRGNQLTSLNVGQLSVLVWLDCENNQLTSLTVTDKPFLQLLFCNVNNLSSLTLGNLPSLANLYCNNNQLTSLNLTGLTALKLFGCAYNQIATLDFTGLNHLQSVNCLNNLPLTGLNLAGHTALVDLMLGGVNLSDPISANLGTVDLSGTNITYQTISNCIIDTLKVTNCASLVDLGLSSSVVSNIILTGCTSMESLSMKSPETSLDVSTLVNLRSLTVSGPNTIPTLDFSHNLNLYALEWIGYNPDTLDLSANTNLTLFRCASDNLRYLLLKNGNYEQETNLEWTFANCPNLLYACVDELQLPFIASIPTFPTTVIGSYCSFTPGGNYNTITGNFKYDVENNGCDAADLAPTNIRVNINDGTTSGATFLTTNGSYTFYTQAGNFDIVPAVENPAWFNLSPAGATIPFADNSNHTEVQDFCLAPNGVHSDVEVVVSPVRPARPGFDAVYQLTYRNKGNQLVSGSVNLTFDDSRTDFVSASPIVDNLAVNSLSWNYTNLLPFETRTIQVTLNVNSPTETPAMNIGDVLPFDVLIASSQTDEIPQDDMFHYDQIVIGAYDPNDISCLEGDVVSASEIGHYLHYAVNFENTGTYPAENVVVKTIVDMARFDIGSLQLMGSSTAVNTRISGNTLEFIFENINLPIGGHGHILLKIKTNDNLVSGDAVAKRADIFFDYNAPVDTGFANTVFQTLSNTTFNSDPSVVVSPNPASHQVEVVAAGNIQSVQFYDVQGRIVLMSLLDATTSRLDISALNKGTYLVKITTEKGISVQKLLKE